MSKKDDAMKRGRDELAKRYIENPDPRTGRPMTADEAHRHAGKVARDLDRKQKESK
ncbi:MAG: hypothetical protein ACPG6R_10960 [Aequoribacter sp.]|uniref:hypothetical protein n=1 Tax=Aequoribacter sp. TaxID=2847771 RepID=UPI003C5A67E3